MYAEEYLLNTGWTWAFEKLHPWRPAHRQPRHASRETDGTSSGHAAAGDTVRLGAFHPKKNAASGQMNLERLASWPL